MIIPKDIMFNNLSVLTNIMSKIPPGLVILDRGFNNRKVFKILLKYEHNLLCRAKSNAVFYLPVKQQNKIGRGRPRKYGERLDIPSMCFRQMDFFGQIIEVSDAIFWTKMCPQPVRLVVRLTFSKKTYKYFCVYTTDINMPIEKILLYYRLRW